MGSFIFLSASSPALQSGGRHLHFDSAKKYNTPRPRTPACLLPATPTPTPSDTIFAPVSTGTARESKGEPGSLGFRSRTARERSGKTGSAWLTLSLSSGKQRKIGSLARPSQARVAGRYFSKSKCRFSPPDCSAGLDALIKLNLSTQGFRRARNLNIQSALSSD